jgi:hypothetical protein
MLKEFADYIKAEWTVLRAAPFSFVILSVLAMSAGFGAGMLIYSGQVSALREQNNTQSGQISRYRVALGIDATSKGAMVELTNDELKAKSATVVLNLRQFCSEMNRKYAEIRAQVDAKKIDEKAASDQKDDFDKRLSDSFVTNFRADTFNVDNELRRRLGPDAVNSIVGVSHSVIADNGAQVDLLSIAISSSSPGFTVGFTCVLADSIEQMAKVLPPDK